MPRTTLWQHETGVALVVRQMWQSNFTVINNNGDKRLLTGADLDGNQIPSQDHVINYQPPALSILTPPYRHLSVSGNGAQRLGEAACPLVRPFCGRIWGWQSPGSRPTQGFAEALTDDSSRASPYCPKRQRSPARSAATSHVMAQRCDANMSCIFAISRDVFAALRARLWSRPHL
ncbi:hypothetical protein LX32DRAFT_247701 [Colletotrichum zoysiae]|uniref:Uncharacterized protein n=1 Tax=Colletotrichum zoysiae TaxID=1216348 RepID=A0AAD9HML9_9PEZI|nr:hypothetical protein LX32DRAFT_247701 [Colletotrichum zoysiae]